MKEWKVTTTITLAEQSAEEAGGHLVAALNEAGLDFELVSVEESEDLSGDSRSSESLTQDTGSSESFARVAKSYGYEWVEETPERLGHWQQSSESVIIITGNPVDGLRFVGPFENGNDAGDYALADEDVEAEWWVTKLVAPSCDPFVAGDPEMGVS